MRAPAQLNCGAIVDTLSSKSSSWRWDTRSPNVTWRIILPVYLFTTELRHTC